MLIVFKFDNLFVLTVQVYVISMSPIVGEIDKTTVKLLDRRLLTI